MKSNCNYSILIVDDRQSNLYSLRQLITHYFDAEVLEASSGNDALKTLLNYNVDLIILDIQMEGMDGFEVASIIKKREKTKDIPIVFLTAAYIGNEFERLGFEVGAVDYVTKPIDNNQLLNRINVYLKLIEKERNMNKLLEEKVREKTRELREAKELAELANETKSMFLANMSHELRTPLNILLSTTRLLEAYLKDDKVNIDKMSNRVHMLKQNCFRLLRLVNNLIDITKIDAGYFELNNTFCNIIQVVEEITMSIVEYAKNKNINVIFDTDMEEVYIKCDLDAIERIVLNLLSNSIKFTPKGGKIFVKILSDDEYISISIKDTGIGIKKEKLDMVFQRFKQAGELMTRGHEGSGIGLSLVKSLVEMHGGKIWVNSKYGKGSEFIVKLPIGSKEKVKDILKENGKEYGGNDDIVQRIHIEFSDIYSS